jgi:signal peptidase I
VPTYRDSSNYPAVIVPEGQFYVLGDHRSTSNDSRNWGPVERKYIVGKAVFAYWPLGRFGALE